MVQKFFKDTYEIAKYMEQQKNLGNHRKGCKCILCKKKAEVKKEE